MIENNIRCPACGNPIWLMKYGKTKAGLQKYRCLEPSCRRQFVAGSDHALDPGTRARVEKLLAADVKPKQIAQAESGISLRWIYALKRKMKLNARSHNSN